MPIEFDFKLERAVRKNLKALVLLYGGTGGGKTMSALELAEGLAGPSGKVAFIDTEHKRGTYYADKYDYSIGFIQAPFTPQKYLTALKRIEDAGFDVAIVDSLSHIWEGEGGIIEMAEKNDVKNQIGKWAGPKAEWKRVRDAFLQSKVHVIFCARSKEPLVEVVENGRKSWVKMPPVPIVPTDFQYEVMLSLGIFDKGRKIQKTKFSDEFSGAFPEGEYVSRKSGEKFAQWLNGGNIIDEALEEKKKEGIEAAKLGREHSDKWWKALSREYKFRLREFASNELKAILEKKHPDILEGINDTPIGNSKKSKHIPDIEVLDPSNNDWAVTAGEIVQVMSDFPDLLTDIEFKYSEVLGQMALVDKDAADYVEDRKKQIQKTQA